MFGLLLLLGAALVVMVLVDWPVLAWGVLHGRPRLLPMYDVIGGLLSRSSERHRSLSAAMGVKPGVLPPLAAGIVLDALLLGGLFLVYLSVAFRVDRWRGRSHVGSASWSLRRKVRARAWAKPRDLLHLQPRAGSRSGIFRRSWNVVLRWLVWERRAPEPAGGDSWPLGFVQGAEIRSAAGVHALVVAPSNAGKTLRVVATAAREHKGALVVTGNKLDVVRETLDARKGVGPVWIYAPLSDLASFGLRGCGWTPLTSCVRWPGALRMAQYLLDADPHAAAAMSGGSDGARFYNRQAVQTVLPGLLHAATLGGHGMFDVYRWLSGGVDALDEPLDVLREHDALAAIDTLGGLHGMDDRTRSLLAISAAQLVGAYRHPEVQALDRRGFDPEALVRDRGTLYLIAPESEQDTLAPVFGGILGELLRTCEQRAQHVADPRKLPVVKVIADEAAHLAPLGKLPTYLAVSRGWALRWMVVYQSIAQVHARYGREADAVLANTLAKIYAGPIHDRTTRDELTGLLGEELVTERSRTSERWGSGHSVTEHQQYRPKLGGDRLAQLEPGTAIVVHGHDLPAEANLPFWWEVEGARTPQDAHAREFERQRREREDRSR